jgi:hypothetical protein
MNEKEMLEQLITDCEEMFKRQREYFKEPKDSPQKYGLMMHSKAQEKKIKEFCKKYRDEQQKKLEPSLFPE